MAPRLTSCDVRDRARRKAILLCQRLARHPRSPRCSNGAHVVFGQSGASTSCRARSLDLIQVAPSLSRDGIGQCRTRHSKVVGDGFMSLSCPDTTPRLDHYGVCKYRGVVAFASLIDLATTSTTSLPVGHVLGMGAVDQMLGSATGRIITGVSRMVRHDTSGQKQSHPIRTRYFVDAGDRVYPTERPIVVGERSATASELPAGVLVVDHVDLGPEPVRQVVEVDRTRLTTSGSLPRCTRPQALEPDPKFSDLGFETSEGSTPSAPSGEGSYCVVIPHGAIIAGCKTTNSGVSEPRHIGRKVRRVSLVCLLWRWFHHATD
jgi:hypothetical protein